MFMSFMCCNGQGNPTGQRICINLSNINIIAELGNWTAQPAPMEGNENGGLLNGDRIPATRRPTVRARTVDTFVAIPNAVSLSCLNGNQWNVVANYTELVKMFESLRDLE